MKTCNGCKHADWYKTKAGKLHPSGEGQCCFPIKMPPLPAAFYWVFEEPSPTGGSINRREEFKKPCPHYQGEPSR